MNDTSMSFMLQYPFTTVACIVAYISSTSYVIVAQVSPQRDRTIVGKHHKAKEEREESLPGIVGYQLMYVNELYKNDILLLL